MKSFKTAFLAMAVVTAMTAAATTSAMAAATYDADNNVVTGYDLPDYTTGSQLTVLLVKQDAGETSEGATVATEENIFYIDQAENGAFTVKPKVGDTSALEAGTYELRIGGEGIDTPTIYVFEVGGSDTEYTLGDVDENGTINVFDVSAMIQYILGNSELTDAQLLAADVDVNDTVNVFDASALIQYVLGNTESL